MSPDKKVDEFNEKNWREIAEEVQTEKDPSKIIGLVQQLLSKLDEEYPVPSVPDTKETGVAEVADPACGENRNYRDELKPGRLPRGTC